MYANIPTGMKICQSLIIPIIWLIIYAITAAYNRYIFFNDSFLSGGLKAIKYIVSIIFYFSDIMTVICHTLTIITNPGTLNYDIVSQLKKSEKDFCYKCDKERPLRAHHCSVCERCFLKMDHHCPWVFNCVGFGNQKYFFLFVFYTILGAISSISMFITFMCTKSYKDLIDARKERKLDFGVNNMFIFGSSFKKWGDILMIIFATVLTAFIFLCVIFLFFGQLSLISSNKTNVEVTKLLSQNDSVNPCNAQGKRCFFLRMVLGLEHKWKCFFPFFEINKYNGGYIYEEKYE
jgi:hypothetical protein